MKALKMIAVLGMAVLVAAQPSEAGVGKSGLTGAAFLKVGVGARAVALGSAYTTVTGDVNQMFWNPAGTAMSGGKAEVLLSHNQWIADLSHQAVGYARDMGDMGTLGIGVVTLGLSDIAADRDAVPQFVLDAGTFDPNDTETSGSYSYRDLAIGVTLALESGALTGDFSGNPSTEKAKQLIVANPKLFREVLKTLHPFRGRLPR